MTRCLDVLKGFATLECPKLDGGCYITEADLLANEGISIPMEAHNDIISGYTGMMLTVDC